MTMTLQQQPASSRMAVLLGHVRGGGGTQQMQPCAPASATGALLTGLAGLAVGDLLQPTSFLRRLAGVAPPAPGLLGIPLPSKETFGVPMGPDGAEYQVSRPGAILSLSVDIYPNVLRNSCDRMYL